MARLAGPPPASAIEAPPQRQASGTPPRILPPGKGIVCHLGKPGWSNWYTPLDFLGVFRDLLGDVRDFLGIVCDGCTLRRHSLGGGGYMVSSRVRNKNVLYLHKYVSTRLSGPEADA